jgi:hypothetical protein
MSSLLQGFNREISGLRWRSSPVIIRYRFPNNDTQLFFVPNNDTLTKYMQKNYFYWKSLFFTSPMRKSAIGPLDNFVEQIKLYHNPKVHYKPTVFKWNVECHEMISKIGLKKVTLITTSSYFLSLITTFSYFSTLITTHHSEINIKCFYGTCSNRTLDLIVFSKGHVVKLPYTD